MTIETNKTPIYDHKPLEDAMRGWVVEQKNNDFEIVSVPLTQKELENTQKQ